MRLTVLLLGVLLLLLTSALAYSVRPQPETVRAEDSMVRTLPTSPPLVPDLSALAREKPPASPVKPATKVARWKPLAPTNDVWDRLSVCESGGNWSDTRGGYEGGVHFTSQTWLAYGGAEFAPHAYLATKEQQIVVARRVLAGPQGPHAWPVCSVKVGLTRSNG